MVAPERGKKPQGEEKMKSSRFQIQAIQKQFPGLFRWPESSADGKVYAERARPLIR
jgi:hypothetical protein